MSNQDGGPAFPVMQDRDNLTGYPMTEGHPGMTLRKWYKGQVMVGLLSGYTEEVDPKGFAEHAGDLADALIAEDEK